MKYIILFFATLALAAAQCKKEHTEPTPVVITPVDTIKPIPIFKDSIVMRKAGVKWLPSSQSYIPNNNEKRFTLGGTRRVGTTSVEDFFSIRDIPFKPGKNKVEYPKKSDDLRNGVPNVTFSVTVDGDQLLTTYWADTLRLSDQYVEVLKCDSVTKIVEGRFNIRLRAYAGTNVPFGLPDTISLLDGYFRVKLKN